MHCGIYFWHQWVSHGGTAQRQTAAPSPSQCPLDECSQIDSVQSAQPKKQHISINHLLLHRRTLFNHIIFIRRNVYWPFAMIHASGLISIFICSGHSPDCNSESLKQTRRQRQFFHGHSRPQRGSHQQPEHEVNLREVKDANYRNDRAMKWMRNDCTDMHSSPNLASGQDSSIKEWRIEVCATIELMHSLCFVWEVLRSGCPVNSSDIFCNNNEAAEIYSVSLKVMCGGVKSAVQSSQYIYMHEKIELFP